jgi:hypothetical protein
LIIAAQTFALGVPLVLPIVTCAAAAVPVMAAISAATAAMPGTTIRLRNTFASFARMAAGTKKSAATDINNLLT